jgi:hypothetical protein
MANACRARRAETRRSTSAAAQASAAPSPDRRHRRKLRRVADRISTTLALRIVLAPSCDVPSVRLAQHKRPMASGVKQHERWCCSETRSRQAARARRTISGNDVARLTAGRSPTPVRTETSIRPSIPAPSPDSMRTSETNCIGLLRSTRRGSESKGQPPIGTSRRPSDRPRILRWRVRLSWHLARPWPCRRSQSDYRRCM